MGLFDELDKLTTPTSKGAVQNPSGGIFDQLDALTKQQQQIEQFKAKQAALAAQAKQKAQKAQQIANSKILFPNTPLTPTITSQAPKGSIFALQQQQAAQAAAAKKSANGATFQPMTAKQAATVPLPAQEIAPSSQDKYGNPAMNIEGNTLQKIQNLGKTGLNVLNTMSTPATAIRLAVPIATGKVGTVTNNADTTGSHYYSLMNAISDLSGKDVDKAISNVPVVGGALDTAANIVGDTLTDPMTFALGGGLGADAKSLSKIGKAADLEEALNIANNVKRASELANDSKLFAAENAINAAKSATPIIENGKQYATVGDKNGITNVEENAVNHAQSLLGNGKSTAVVPRDAKTVAIAQKIANGEPLTQEEASHLAQNIQVEKPVESSAVAAEAPKIENVATTEPIKPVEQPSLNNPLNIPIGRSEADYGNSLGANQMRPEKVQNLLRQEVEDEAPKYTENHFSEPLNVNTTGKAGKQAQGYIERAVTEENANRLKANQLADDIRNTVKDVGTRQALVHIAETPDAELRAAHLNGIDTELFNNAKKLEELKAIPTDGMNTADKAILEKNITDTQKAVNDGIERIPENIKNLDRPLNVNGQQTTLRDMLAKAENLNDVEKQTAQNATDFTRDIGKLSQERHTIDGTVSNYLAHEYEEPDIANVDTEKLEANKQQAMNEKFSPKNVETESANNAKHRTYATYADAIMHGETPKTLDLADLIEKTGNEQAHKNAVSGLLHDLVSDDIAKVDNRLHNGYKEIASTASGKIQLPKELAKAFTPILDNDYAKGYGGKTYHEILNNLKTIELGLSAFHYKNLIIAAANNGDIKATAEYFKDLPKHLEFLNEPEFRENELDFVRHGGMTSMVENNLDTAMKLNKNETRVGQLINELNNKPVFKQIGKAIEANNSALFAKLQRFVKVQAYDTRVNAWFADHVNATASEINRAKSSIAREINGVYGGMNWKMLRVPKGLINTMKTVMLAPDWTFSNIDLARQAFNPTNHTAGARAARAFWIRNIIIGAITTEGLNYAFTGHGTWENAKGHELDVETMPGVHVSTLSGTMKDAATLVGDITKNGLGAIPQFAESKLNAPTRTAIGLLTQRDYYGNSLIDKNGNPVNTTANNLKYAGEELIPVPFGTTSAARYVTDKNISKGPQTAAGAAIIGTGLGQYGKPSTSAEPYAGNWLYGLTPKGRAEAQLNQNIKSFKAQQKAARAASNANNPTYQAKKALSTQEDSTVKSFMSLSKVNRQKFLDSLSDSDRQIVMDKLNKLGISY